jgi:hypothetical protein
MPQSRTNQAFFAGLVEDTDGRLADVTTIGDTAYYVVMDGDFRRHVEAAPVDQQVLRVLSGQIEAHRDVAVEGMLRLLGQDDLFTKAAVDASIKNIDQVLNETMPPEARSWLSMLGFRVVIDYHGDLVRVDLPAGEVDDDE